MWRKTHIYISWTKSTKNHAIGFVLTAVSAESSSEDDKVESDCSSEIGSSSAQPDENSDESTEEGSCSPEEFSENEETSKTFVHTVSHEIAFNLPREPSANRLHY